MSGCTSSRIGQLPDKRTASAALQQICNKPPNIMNPGWALELSCGCQKVITSPTSDLTFTKPVRLARWRMQSHLGWLIMIGMRRFHE